MVSTLDSENKEQIVRHVYEREPRHRIRGGKIGKIVTAGVVVLGLVGAATIAKEFGIKIPGIGGETKRELQKPDVTVQKIKPIDFGSFVEVDSTTRLQLNEHKILKFGPVSKTVWTNTTTAENQGEGRLTVDNKYTTVTVTEDPNTHKEHMDVNIGDLFPEGWIVHNGHDGAKTDRAFGQRFGELFGGDGNQNLKAGLDLVAQEIFTNTPCLNEAVSVAETSIQHHYQQLADEIGKGAITDVRVTYDHIPTAVHIPTGDINTELKEMGVDVPSNWQFVAESPVCHVTEINGHPAAAG